MRRPSMAVTGGKMRFRQARRVPSATVVSPGCIDPLCHRRRPFLRGQVARQMRYGWPGMWSGPVPRWTFPPNGRGAGSAPAGCSKPCGRSGKPAEWCWKVPRSTGMKQKCLAHAHLLDLEGADLLGKPDKNPRRSPAAFHAALSSPDEQKPHDRTAIYRDAPGNGARSGGTKSYLASGQQKRSRDRKEAQQLLLPELRLRLEEFLRQAAHRSPAGAGYSRETAPVGPYSSSIAATRCNQATVMVSW